MLMAKGKKFSILNRTIIKIILTFWNYIEFVVIDSVCNRVKNRINTSAL